jgi:hypothetical protein
MKTAGWFITLVTIYQIIWHHIPYISVLKALMHYNSTTLAISNSDDLSNYSQLLILFLLSGLNTMQALSVFQRYIMPPSSGSLQHEPP